jgi:hypothetical protein
VGAPHELAVPEPPEHTILTPIVLPWRHQLPP